jgi:sigma-B regulation protein RsbU (phosphoserine phosphatase)
MFVTDRLDLPQTICDRLATQKWLCQTTSLSFFLDSAETESMPAAVLLDAHDINLNDSKRTEEKIHVLDRKNIPVILLNWPIAMELSVFRIASKVRSASVEELWARIELAMHFSPALAENPLRDEQRQQMEEQLKMAGAVQRNFLPQTLPATDRVRMACVYQPAQWVSGDIYDAVRLDENHIAIYLADAVGHSMPAALLTMFLKHAAVLRQTRGSQYTIFTPQQVLDRLNEQMIAQQLKGCLFATCCCGLLNTQTMNFTFARAGHPYPILLRRGCPPISLQSRGGLLGVFEEIDIEEQTIAVQSGDKIMFYSDGAEPLIGEINNTGQFLFTDTFLSLCDLPVVSMVETLEHAAAGWKCTSAEIDDITILAMEIL